MVEKQELHCHNCNNYVQFDIDLELNGNHVLNCPNCGHQHCRVVKDGKITDERWGSTNNTYHIGSATTTAISTYTVYSVNSVSVNSGDMTNAALYYAWMNTITNA
jgi:hypothetical protein